MLNDLFRSRPAAFAALGLAIGIACSSFNSFSIFILFSFCIFSIVLYRRKANELVFLFSVFALLGNQLMVLDQKSYSDTVLTKIASAKPAKVILTGKIEGANETTSSYLWSLSLDSIAIPKEQSIPAHGDILLRLSTSGYNKIALPNVGDRIRVYSSLEPFRNPSNPHEFASDLRLQSATHTEAIGYVHSRFDCEILYRGTPSIWDRIQEDLNSVHATLLHLLDIAIKEGNSRGFVEAVVLGDRSDMDKETLNDFTTAGVAHILAVSGFNVAIVSLVVAQLLRIFGIYWHRTRISITMLAVLAYSAIVGFQPSVVRALLMIELYLLATLLERKPDPLNIVMSAAALNLIFRPQDLFDVGFQLSYAGVLGMVLIAPKILWLFGLTEDAVRNNLSNEKKLWNRRWFKQLASATALSIGASIVSYPVIAAHFYRISFIGLLANLPLIPLSAIITAYGFLLLPLTAISTGIGQLYGTATSYMTDLLLILTHFSAHLPSAAHAAASPSWIFLVSLSIAAIYCFRSKARKQFLARMSIAFATFFAASTIDLPFTNSVLAQNEGKLQVLFFDVGQGDCIFLRTPYQKSYFIDFGRIEQNGNTAMERTAIPFLRAENITHIDAGFISHMHADHYGGASPLLQQCSVSSLFSSGERIHGRAASVLDSIANITQVHLHTLQRGDTIHLDSELTLYVLYPSRNAPIEMSQYDIHRGMLVFKIVYRNTSFLFLGDAERSEEESMLADYGTFLKSNVVKVAHHGSETSSSKEFVSATHPDFAVISVGEHNLFGHPSPAIVKRWNSNGSKVFRTDKDGAILFTSDGYEVKRDYW